MVLSVDVSDDLVVSGCEGWKVKVWDIESATLVKVHRKYAYSLVSYDFKTGENYENLVVSRGTRTRIFWFPNRRSTH